MKSLRKLEKYYPGKKNYLYRCITSKLNINYDVFNKKMVPYINGKVKIFWGFTSVYPDSPDMNFFGGEDNNKSGTVFTLAVKVSGYDINCKI